MGNNCQLVLFSKLYFKIFPFTIQIYCKVKVGWVFCLFYFCAVSSGIRTNNSISGFKIFLLCGFSTGTKAVPSRHLMTTSHCYMFSLEHKTVVSTEIFIGVRLGRDAILRRERLFLGTWWDLRDVGGQGDVSAVLKQVIVPASLPAVVAGTCPMHFIFWAVSEQALGFLLWTQRPDCHLA